MEELIDIAIEYFGTDYTISSNEKDIYYVCPFCEEKNSLLSSYLGSSTTLSNPNFLNEFCTVFLKANFPDEPHLKLKE